ncbi:MAG: hypothetical protein R3224_07685, partial [Balneolaceae bacterium]|nr:hypothetical protein [Balneolaceae bacterium]
MGQPETMELIPMMQLLMADIYRIDEGIYTENFELIREGGLSIAHHPVMTEEDKAMIQKALGNEFKRFVRYDMIVHRRADSLAAAASQQNMEAVLRNYRIVQEGCVDCHSDFRSTIVD